MTMRQPEKAIQRDVIRALRALGFDVDDMSQPRASMMARGLPDLRARHPRWRTTLWVEVKTPRGRLSDHQRQWHELEHACGGTVLVTRSADELLEQLAALGLPIAL